MQEMQKQRCAWPKSELDIQYHDNEWGVPLHDERGLFEFLVLEGAQAGLSWSTILRKRDNYRAVFDNFDPVKVASYGDKKVAALLADEGIIRNRLKIAAAIQNARAFLDIQDRFGSFDTFIWQFADKRSTAERHKAMKTIPATTPESDSMSKELKRLGFKFVGSTICYAFMQATGMVNDHAPSCFRYKEIG
jgi:DNA-3-methyladenine glycosylase I